MTTKITTIVVFFPLTLSANTYVDLFKEETPSLWLSLFALSIISMISLYLSSEKLKELDIKYLMISKKEKEIEKQQQMLLEFMSAKIETSTKGIIQRRKEFSQHFTDTLYSGVNPSLFKDVIEKFEESESVLLDATHELVDFLKIKSSTLELKNESYAMHNVMNETFSLLHDTMKKTKTELVYDIDPTISNELKGDSRRLEQILVTLCNDAMSTTRNSTILLSISPLKAKKQQMCIDIYNTQKVMPQIEIDTLLENYSLKEEYKSDDKLYMYVAYKLIRLMGGTFSIVSDPKDGTHYKIKLPYLPVNEKTDKKSTMYDGKRCLVAVENTILGEVLKKRLGEYNVYVDLVIEESLQNLHKNVDNYDAMIVDNLWVNHRLRNELSKRSIESIFVLKSATDSSKSVYENDLYSYIYKPLQKRQIDNMLEKAFGSLNIIGSKEVSKKTVSSPENVVVLRDKQGIGQESFKVFSHLHILIAEDNIMNQKILKSVFSKSGMTIFMANNGLEALELVQNNSEIDLVFLDTNMPVMDGYEACRQIRLFRNKRMLPIIGIDSIGFSNTTQDTSGMNAFLHKPFKIGQIYTALSKYTSIEKSSVKFITHKLNKYEHNKKILDIFKGISQANTAIFYKEVLTESLQTLRHTEEEINQYIVYSKYKELKAIILDTIRLSEIIGATGLRLVLLEMIQTFDYNQENQLSEYVPLLSKELFLLTKEMNEYLKT